MVKVGSDYYLVNSTFAYFLAVKVHTLTDLSFHVEEWSSTAKQVLEYGKISQSLRSIEMTIQNYSEDSYNH